MRTLMATAGTLIFAAGCVAGGSLQPQVGAQGSSVVMDCGASSTSQVRTTLYFGLARPKGSVTELEWQIFLRDEVTKRLPRRADRVGGGGPVADTRWHHRSRAVEGPAPGPSRYAGGAAIGHGRDRCVSQDVRAAIRSAGKRARVCRGLVSPSRGFITIEPHDAPRLHAGTPAIARLRRRVPRQFQAVAERPRRVRLAADA